MAHGCWGRRVRLATKPLLLSVPEPHAPPGSDTPHPENHCGDEVLVASDRVPIPATVWTGRLPGLGCARQGRGCHSSQALRDSPSSGGAALCDSQ